MVQLLFDRTCSGRHSFGRIAFSGLEEARQRFATLLIHCLKMRDLTLLEHCETKRRIVLINVLPCQAIFKCSFDKHDCLKSNILLLYPGCSWPSDQAQRLDNSGLYTSYHFSNAINKRFKHFIVCIQCRSQNCILQKCMLFFKCVSR